MLAEKLGVGGRGGEDDEWTGKAESGKIFLTVRVGEAYVASFPGLPEALQWRRFKKERRRERERRERERDRIKEEKKKKKKKVELS